MSKKCTPLWREAYFRRKHLAFGALLEVDMLEKWTPLWRKARFEVKMYKAPHLRSTFGSWHVEKVHAVVVRSAFPSQNVKTTTCSDRFCTFKFCFAWHALGIVHLVNNEQSVRVLWHFQKHPKTMAGVGHLKRICKDALSVAGAVQETCSSSEMLGCPGADFLREVAFWIIRSSIFGKVILCDRCSNSYDLAPFFRRRRNTLDRWSGQIAKRIGMRPSALHSTFLFWRKPPRIASFGAVNFGNWGSFAELLRFWRCQVGKLWGSSRIFRFWRCQLRTLRGSRRIASFSSLQIDR